MSKAISTRLDVGGILLLLAAFVIGCMGRIQALTPAKWGIALAVGLPFEIIRSR